MIKEFILSIISIAFLSTVCEMIIPEGKMKSYYKLVFGFILMCVLIKPVGNINNFPEIDFSSESVITEEELKAASNAYILKIHEENIKSRICELCGDDIEIFIELFSDGNIRSVTIRGEVPSTTIEFLKTELGCNDIKVISDG